MPVLPDGVNSLARGFKLEEIGARRGLDDWRRGLRRDVLRDGFLRDVRRKFFFVDFLRDDLFLLEGRCRLGLRYLSRKLRFNVR